MKKKGTKEINIKNRRHRSPRPYDAFYKQFFKTVEAISEASELGITSDSLHTIQSAHIINSVTSFEVYFRDTIDAIFRLCKPDLYYKNLDKVFKRKYSVTEMIDIFEGDNHPLATLPDERPIQSTKAAFEIFSNLFNFDLSSKIRENEYRLADNPKTIFKVDKEIINAVDFVCSIRHELVHNPNPKIDIEDIYRKSHSVGIFVVVADLVIWKELKNYAKTGALIVSNNIENQCELKSSNTSRESVGSEGEA